MKKLILWTTLLLSMQTFAGMFQLSRDIEAYQHHKERVARYWEENRAKRIEFANSPSMSPELRRFIDKVQSKYPELSDEDVVDILLEADY